MVPTINKQYRQNKGSRRYTPMTNHIMTLFQSRNINVIIDYTYLCGVIYPIGVKMDKSLPKQFFGGMDSPNN